MLTASPAYATAILGTDTVVGIKVTIQLPVVGLIDVTGCTTSVSLDSQMNTDLPDTVRTESGLSNIGGDITLAGPWSATADETQDVCWLLDPDATDSPMYHYVANDAPVTVSLGLLVPGSTTPEWVPKLAGFVNGYDIDHGERTVTLHVVDLDPTWDTTPDIPAVVTVSPFNAGLTSEYPMDALIRSVRGASTWPATRIKSLLAVGFRASVWPEVGHLNTDYSINHPYTFAPGPYGTGLAGVAVVNPLGANIGAVYDIAQPQVYTIMMEFYVSQLTGRVAVGIGNIQVAGGAYQFLGTLLTVDPTAVQFGGTTVLSGPIDHAVHYVGVKATYNPATAAWAGTARLDGVSATFSGITTIDPTTATIAHVKPTNAVVAGVQISYEANPGFNSAFVPAAVLDPSLNPLQVVPEISAGTLPWDELQTMAAAECGYIRRDELGVVKFSNRITMAGAAVQRSITALDSLKEVNSTIPASATNRTVNVPYTEWTFGARSAVFVLASAKKIPAATTVTWTQPLDTLAASVTSNGLNLPDGHNPLDGGTWYRASLDPNGVDPHPGLTVTVTQVTAASVKIAVQNSTNKIAYLVSSSYYSEADLLGQPALWVGGIPVTPADEAIATAVYGDAASPLTFPSNPYLQDHATAQAVAAWLLNQTYTLIRDYVGVTIVPDGRVQPADITRITDGVMSPVDEYVMVWGWHFSYEAAPAGGDGTTWDMSLDVRAMGPPGAWLAQFTDRNQVGVFWAYN